ncbi:MAG TPA: hypothetical protein VMT53_19775 [Terriglobales bacterium]|nr:hypothetical protein [Terriglobales bacterium]
MVESRLRLESDVRKLLREVSASAEHALNQARELAARGTTAVQNELERLNKLRDGFGKLSVPAMAAMPDEAAPENRLAS